MHATAVLSCTNSLLFRPQGCMAYWEIDGVPCSCTRMASSCTFCSSVASVSGRLTRHVDPSGARITLPSHKLSVSKIRVHGCRPKQRNEVSTRALSNIFTEAWGTNNSEELQVGCDQNWSCLLLEIHKSLSDFVAFCLRCCLISDHCLIDMQTLSQTVSSQLFAFSIFPYAAFLYYLTKSRATPRLM